MTTTTTPASAELITLRFGHPIRSFVLTLSALAIVAVACWWMGLVAPRLGVSLSARTMPGSGAVALTFEVSNPGPLPMSLLAVDVHAQGFRTDRTVDGDRRSNRLFRPVRLGPFEHRLVTTIFRRKTCQIPFEVSARAIALTARSPLGVTRTVRPTSQSYVDAEGVCID